MWKPSWIVERFRVIFWAQKGAFWVPKLVQKRSKIQLGFRIALRLDLLVSWGGLQAQKHLFSLCKTFVFELGAPPEHNKNESESDVETKLDFREFLERFLS